LEGLPGNTKTGKKQQQDERNGSDGHSYINF
jgi:hypothetical protein